MKKTVNILGLNAYHGDASAALIVDGELIAAVEEERFNRIKHWAGFPTESIKYCLDAAGLKPESIDHVAVSFNPRANLIKKMAHVLKCRPSIDSLFDRYQRQRKTLSLEKQFAYSVGVGSEKLTAEFHRVEHHNAHIAAGYLISPFDDAAVLSVDGMGDFTSTVSAIAKNRSWRELERVFYPHSIGFLYTAVTMYLGFPHYGDEYKVMGLAPYGEPEYADEIRKMIRPAGDVFELNLDYFTHHLNGISMSWEEGAPVVQPFLSGLLEKRLGLGRLPSDDVTAKHENLAKSLQVVTEEILMHMLTRLHDKSKCDSVCMTGGVAMNSVANGKITQETPFQKVFIPAGAADNGTAFGAAYHVWNRVLDHPRKYVQNHAYLGCEFSDDECEVALKDLDLPFEIYHNEALWEHVSDLIIDGNVVGWFQGRMEFGARALGSRSLVADPRRTDMRDIINLRIKFREKFRPFAPSILEEEVSSWFEIDELAPYMEKVFPILKSRRKDIPAVTHVDGSGRLQSVSKNTNRNYHGLISCFFRKTGVPILLNTSLNENEPVVCTPKEAISCFLRTDMDVLVIGPYVVNRHSDCFPKIWKGRVDLRPGEVPNASPRSEKNDD